MIMTKMLQALLISIMRAAWLTYPIPDFITNNICRLIQAAFSSRLFFQREILVLQTKTLNPLLIVCTACFDIKKSFICFL